VYLLEKALKRLNLTYELTHFEDGELAMRLLAEPERPTPDLILVDLNLPKRDGFEVLRSVRSRPALVGVPVGIFTSSEAAADRSRASLLGAERYIHKPAELEQFIKEVGDAIEGMLHRA